ncbi:MAG: type III-A CRISPR-associated RAMP protein Csm3 [candidate division Zixibacteria bacterium HGW-Zixibacteria-1]|nr:MAG: type III-A CRISPR-associated RAMP protein Csm3 [candidate division Zixibacteria bacterium HGW-Zixibacteria-1]
MQLERYLEIEGQITCLAGLKIGGTKETIGIGETDKPIIRHPVNRLPYIPGSSLKGKLISLLEIKDSPRSQQSGRPCDCGNCKICILFGRGDPRESSQPTRLIFRDAQMSEKTRELLEEALPGSYAEIKTEIQMDRKEGKAAQRALRQQERIPEGSIFDFSISMRIFDVDVPSIKEYLNYFADAFDLLEKDYLGGNGSRGYGKVKFTSADGRPISEYLRTMKL